MTGMALMIKADLVCLNYMVSSFISHGLGGLSIKVTFTAQAINTIGKGY
jgi:hypothetical protein